MRQRPLQLDRIRRRVAACEFHTGRQANAAVHRRQEVATIRIQNGMMQHRIAARRQMQVIATLDAERNRKAERTQYQIGPRPQCQHHFSRDRGVIAGRHPP